MSEEFRYIEGMPPERKDIPEHPLTKLGKRYIWQLRKRDINLISSVLLIEGSRPPDPRTDLSVVKALEKYWKDK